MQETAPAWTASPSARVRGGPCSRARGTGLQRPGQGGRLPLTALGQGGHRRPPSFSQHDTPPLATAQCILHNACTTAPLPQPLPDVGRQRLPETVPARTTPLRVSEPARIITTPAQGQTSIEECAHELLSQFDGCRFAAPHVDAGCVRVSVHPALFLLWLKRAHDAPCAPARRSRDRHTQSHTAALAFCL